MLIRGEYKNIELTNEGREQISRFAKEMKEIVGKKFNGLYLASSLYPSTIQSAYIIANTFDYTSFEQNEQLCDRKLRGGQIKSIDKMVNPHLNNNNIITLVTEKETFNSYLPHIAERLLGESESFRVFKEGEGVHFDLKNKMYEQIPRRG